MDARTRTPQEIFGTHVRYVIPTFQRPYVWEEETQWQPLWEDVQRTAERVSDVLEGGGSLDSVSPHFLGAIVLEQMPIGTGFIHSRSVVDGQQRLTTLQLLLDAVQLVVAEHGREIDAEALRDLVMNNAKTIEDKTELFKVWPSRVDRTAFVETMTDDIDPSPAVLETLIFNAHKFFRQAATEWADPSDDPVAVKQRLRALTTVLHRHMAIVAIDLTPADNPQIIFETLNDRGTPLLAADLVKNHIFRAAEDAGVDVDDWDRRYWADFSDEWWRDAVRQGRYLKSRIDIFLQHWLTMRLQEEVPSEEIFRRFRAFAQARGIDKAASGAALLAELRHDADQFRGFANFKPESPEGTFYYRIVEALQMGVVTPVLLWLLAERHKVPPVARAQALAALESWVIRRTLLGLTTKDINRLVVALLKELAVAVPDAVGVVTEQFLAAQTANSRYWPTDEQLVDQLPAKKVYNVIQQGRIRMILEAVEDRMRTAKSELAHCPRGALQIEHVMPQSWQQYWGIGVLGDPVAETRRDRLVHSLGNLTLVSAKLNPALANLPWADPDAQAAGGSEGKRSQLNRHSVLVINHRLVDDHPQSWGENDIEQRGHDLVGHIVSIWPAKSGSQA